MGGKRKSKIPILVTSILDGGPGDSWELDDQFVTADPGAPLLGKVAGAYVINVGTLTGGTLPDTYTRNAADLVITEVAGVPGFNVEFTIPVAHVGQKVTIYGHYAGNPAHTVRVQADNGGGWDNLGTLPNAGAHALYQFDLLAAHTISGLVTLRIYHETTGTPGHTLNIDQLAVQDQRSAQPGPGVMTVWKDTSEALSIVGGDLIVNGSVAANDPRLYYEPPVPFPRMLGRVAFYEFMVVALVGGYTFFGFNDTPESGSMCDSGILLAITDAMQIIIDDTSFSPEIFDLVAGVWYQVAIIMRTTGQFTFIKGGVFTDWTMVYPVEGSTDTTLNLVIAQSVTRETHFGQIRVPTQLWWPRPILSDGFSADPVLMDVGDHQVTATPTQVGFGGPKGCWLKSGRLALTLAEVDHLFQPDQGTVIQLIQVADWSGADYGATFTHYVGVNSNIYMRLNNSAGKYAWVYVDDGGVLPRVKSGLSLLTPWVAGITTDRAAGEVKAFYDGAKEGATMVPTGAYGTPTARILLGAQSAGTWNFSGWIKDTILGLNGTVVSEADMATITTALKAGTLTAAQLDILMGVGNWAWWQHDQVRISDGQGHQEADGGIVLYAGSPMYQAAGELFNDPPGGADLLTNGDFSAWTADDPDGWTVAGEVGADPEVTERGSGQTHAGGGAGAANLFSTAGTIVISQAAILTIGKWYRLIYDVTAVAGGSTRGYIGTSYTIRGNSVVENEMVYLADAVDMQIQNEPGAADQTIDWATIKEVAIEDLVDVVNHGAADVIADVIIPTIADGHCQGVALCIDDPDNVQNGVLAYYQKDLYGLGKGGSDVEIMKVVGGTWTTLGTVAVVHGAAKVLRVAKKSTTFEVYYDDVLLTTAIIADAGIVDNQYHGAFITGGGSLADLTIWKSAGWGSELTAL